MKNLFLITFLILLTATSCKKESIAKSDEYDTSLKAWLNYKSDVGNSYQYTITYGSWTGYGVEITTGISKGQFVFRDFTSFRYRNDGSGKKDTLKSWHEDTATINTHTQDAGEIMTIDEIYTKARTVWLKVDASANDIFFEAKNNGIISSCGYVPHGCQDDCFNGVKIKSITAL